VTHNNTNKLTNFISERAESFPLSALALTKNRISKPHTVSSLEVQKTVTIQSVKYDLSLAPPTMNTELSKTLLIYTKQGKTFDYSCKFGCDHKIVLESLPSRKLTFQNDRFDHVECCSSLSKFKLN